MKRTAAVLTILTAAVLATPTTAPPPKCVYGAYRCASPPTSIEVCDYYGNWQPDWQCKKGTTCQMLASGGGMIPYCTTPTTPGTKCTTPGKYECMGTGAIQVCNAAGEYEKVGDCPAGTKCGLLGTMPYCL